MCVIRLGGCKGAGHLVDRWQQVGANKSPSNQWKAQRGDTAVSSQLLAEAKLTLSSCPRASQLGWPSADAIILISLNQTVNSSWDAQPVWDWVVLAFLMVTFPLIDPWMGYPQDRLWPTLPTQIDSGWLLDVSFLKSLTQWKTNLLAQLAFDLLGLLPTVIIYTDRCGYSNSTD